MLDLLIRNALVVDGTGAPGTRHPVGVRDGRITLAVEGEPARRTLDADGLVLAPGFIDIHTHFDAQLGWDGHASPSLLHGTTTVIGGNCGFSIAPLRPDMADYLVRMLAVVEGIPLASLQSALAWNWDSFGGWLGAFESRIAVNAGFFAGHSAIRTAVMGEAGISEPASAQQVEQMQALLAQCLEAGAFGFSTSLSDNHLDAAGHPVPSRAAAREELLGLCATLKRFPGTSLQLAPAGSSKGFEPAEVALMTDMSLAAGRPINWNLLMPKEDDPGFVARQLKASDYARERGARIVALSLPAHRLRVTFASGMPLNSLPGWASTFALDLEARQRALADPEVRRRLREAARVKNLGSKAKYVRWGAYRVLETFLPGLKQHEGRTVEDIARVARRDPFDALLDLVVEDGLRTALEPAQPQQDGAAWRERADIWRDPRVLLAGSDAGAHLDNLCSATYTTRLLAEGVREHGVLSLEEAVHLLTGAPARFYGMTERGRIAQGCRADLVLFDPRTVAALPERERSDFPGGAKRVFAGAIGIERVFVNGREVLAAGEPTGALSGQVLRAGRDTAGVSLDAR